jgi:gamma-glutamylcyclotransferase (GGCT)/AIG2-like uncharacterized protein YtfP
MCKRIFAYGSNLCPGRLRDHGVHSADMGVKAWLSGYRLRFNKRSSDGSGKANLEQHEGSRVWGVLYSISDADLDTLDRGEGGYDRVCLSVVTPDGKEHQAQVYLASEPGNDADLRPYTWYKRFLVEGALEHGLPSEYIATLEKIEAVQDPDPDRDRRMRTLPCPVG